MLKVKCSVRDFMICSSKILPRYFTSTTRTGEPPSQPGQADPTAFPASILPGGLGYTLPGGKRLVGVPA